MLGKGKPDICTKFSTWVFSFMCSPGPCPTLLSVLLQAKIISLSHVGLNPLNNIAENKQVKKNMNNNSDSKVINVI